MLTQRQLTDRAVILTETEGARSGTHNNPTITWTPANPVPALAQQQASTEQLDNRDQVTTRRILFLPAGTAITATSRVQLASVPDVTWRVSGDPAPLSELGGRPSHIEAVIEKV